MLALDMVIFTTSHPLDPQANLEANKKQGVLGDMKCLVALLVAFATQGTFTTAVFVSAELRADDAML